MTEPMSVYVCSLLLNGLDSVTCYVKCHLLHVMFILTSRQVCLSVRVICCLLCSLLTVYYMFVSFNVRVFQLSSQYVVF